MSCRAELRRPLAIHSRRAASPCRGRHRRAGTALRGGGLFFQLGLEIAQAGVSRGEEALVVPDVGMLAHQLEEGLACLVVVPQRRRMFAQFSLEIAQFINHFGWQGKTFDAERGILTNRISVFGINAIVATVYKDKSWLDGKECIVLDYSKTSLLAHWIRDEIRQVGPGVYLGIVFWGKKKLIDFALKFPNHN